MKITNLDVDGYGVWSGLRIEHFSDALNVFYGPNEAGKTTLLQFIRSMLYGFSPQRRRYLPPLHGGRAGGTLDVASPHGRFQISRHDSADDGTPGEQLTLTAPDGTRQGEHFVKVLLSNVDETVFNNVFAVGLREIQELATLSDTEAAELLYNLTAGLDRVSLVEVLQELDASRNRILDAAGRPCQVLQLLADYEKLRAEIEELAAAGHRYGHLAAEREQLHVEITQREEESNRIERLARVADLALAVRDRWTQRAALDEQLSAIGPLKIMPEGAVERLDAFNARTQKHQERLDRLTQQTAALRAEFAGLAVNDALWRQTARIEAFKEQEPWIAQLQSQIAELEKEIAGLNGELTAESERLGLGAAKEREVGMAGTDVGMAVALPSPVSRQGAAVQLPPQLDNDGKTWPKSPSVPFSFELSRKRLASLRSPAKVAQHEQRRWREARQAAARAADNAHALAREIEAALAAHGQTDLSSALDGAGNLVSQYRRRVQIDERLDQLARHRVELEEQSRSCSERQLLPVNALVGLGVVFVLGMVLVLAGLFLAGPITGGIGWGLVVVGLGGIATSVGSKILIERSNEKQLEDCQKQLATLKSHVAQTADDRDSLDAQLPRGGGPIVSRLQAAENELAALEAIALEDAKRAAAQQDAEVAARRADEARQSLKAARRRWRQSLVAAGLPQTIAAKQVRRLVERGDWIAETQQRLSQRREELARRQAELDAFATRIVQLAADAGTPVCGAGVSPALAAGTAAPQRLLDQLHELAEAAARQATFVERREAIRRERRQLRAAQRKREEAIGRQKHRRRQLFIEVGVNNEQEFRQRALESARSDVLRRQREAIAREIEAALASQCSEEAIRQQLENDYPGLLESRSGELRQRLVGIQAELRGLLEKRGRLNEQLESLAADRRMASKQIDLAVLESRLEEAIHHWQVLATTCHMLDVIRDAYQQHRQPETLQEASLYLDRLTQGRYRRVWTPLGDRSLRVDDAEGHALAVEALSRGTREQLFLSLRLALASSYARRGSPLPLVLDDVLVNFDAERAKAAAAVLRDFAAAGHQLLVFTCHEHIHRLFKSLKVPVSSLPSNAEPGPTVIVLQAQAADEERPKRERQLRPSRRKTAAKQEMPRADDSGFREDGAEEEIDDAGDEVADEDDSLWEAEDEGLNDLDDSAAA
ncbi:MAG: AAA family ATPase [Thermoguttaceae bacterium]